MRKKLTDELIKYTECFAFLKREDVIDFFTEKVKVWADSTVKEWNFILIAAIPYNNGEEKPEYGIARYAWGEDYHRVAYGILDKLSAIIQSSGGECFVFCDTSPVPEREISAAAGLGVIGRNGLLITEKYGSYVVLAGMLIRCADLKTDTPMLKQNCINCGACIKACPGHAIEKNGFLIEYCISEITQKRGELTESEKKLLRDNKALWGCDICQDVCPMNKNKKLTAIAQFKENLIKTLPDDICSMSNREFKQKYGDRAFSWRGAAVLKRNIELNKTPAD